MKRPTLPLCLASLCLTGAASAQDFAKTVHPDDWDSLTGSNVEVLGITPHFHILGGVGASTADSLEDLANGHHDANDDYTLQTAEVGLSARWGQHVEGFFTHAFYSEPNSGDREYHHETEELFLKLVNLPLGTEIRGGKFLNRFGFQNAVHNHSWDFANQNLANGALLSEGELTTIGAEFSIRFPTEFPLFLSLYGGDAPDHEAHVHLGPPPLFEGPEGELDEDILGLNLLAQYNLSDFHQFTATASLVHGQNHFETDTTIAGLGLQYQWRENGLEPGGRSLTLRTEAMARRFEAINAINPAIRDDIEQIGGYVSQIYQHNDHWSFANRIGYVTGRDDAELTERFRLSQAVTWYANPERTLFSRIQLDNDWLDGNNAHDTTIWFQLGFNWGGPEVR